MPDYDKLNYYTGANYMKRSNKSGTGSIASIALPIAHNLGYVPQFNHYVELDGDGFIWYGGERVFEGTESTAGGGSTVPVVDAWSDANTLTLYPTNSTGTRTCYWLIYLDYAGI